MPIIQLETHLTKVIKERKCGEEYKEFPLYTRYFIPIITLGGDGASRLAVQRSKSRRGNVHSADLLKSLDSVTNQLS